MRLVWHIPWSHATSVSYTGTCSWRQNIQVMLLRFSNIKTCSWCHIYPEAMLLVLVTQEHAPWCQNIQVMLLRFSFIRTCSWCHIYHEAMLLVLVTHEHAPGVRISKVMLLRFSYIRTCSWCQNIQSHATFRTCSWCMINSLGHGTTGSLVVM